MTILIPIILFLNPIIISIMFNNESIFSNLNLFKDIFIILIAD